MRLECTANTSFGAWWISTARDQYATQVDGLVRGSRHAHTGDMHYSRTQCYDPLRQSGDGSSARKSSSLAVPTACLVMRGASPSIAYDVKHDSASLSGAEQARILDFEKG